MVTVHTARCVVPELMSGAPTTTTKWRSPTSCALELDVVEEVVWQAVKPSLPTALVVYLREAVVKS